MQPGLAIAALLALAFCLGCTRGAPTLNAPPRLLQAKEAIGLIANDFGVLIDVRDPSEVTKGSPKGAIKLPLPAFQRALAGGASPGGLSKEKTLILCCGTDRALLELASTLENLGYKAAVLPRFAEWKDAGLPVD